MNAAEKFPTHLGGITIDATALYALAAPEVPQEAKWRDDSKKAGGGVPGLLLCGLSGSTFGCSAVMRRLVARRCALSVGSADAQAQRGDGGEDHGLHRNSPSISSGEMSGLIYTWTSGAG
jgi:hypothetical protein